MVETARTANAQRSRPAGVTDATITALGKLSEALEVVEDARGALYRFHRLSGRADLTLQEAVRLLRDAGWNGLADDADRVLVGRDVIPGRWTFEIVEDYDDTYWNVFRKFEEQARHLTGVTERHIYEAETKKAEQLRYTQVP
jgi:hypothetical protein